MDTSSEENNHVGGIDEFIGTVEYYKFMHNYYYKICTDAKCLGHVCLLKEEMRNALIEEGEHDSANCERFLEVNVAFQIVDDYVNNRGIYEGFMSQLPDHENKAFLSPQYRH